MSELRKAVLTKTPPRKPAPGQGSKMSHGRFNNFTPIPWTEAFAEQITVKIEKDGKEIGEYVVYLRYKQMEAKDFDLSEPTIVFLHGCGYSGLTWGETILETDQYLDDVQMAAIDLRGHGLTKTTDDYSLSFDVLMADLLQVFSKTGLDTHPLVLVGHSMGGALAIRLTEYIEQNPVRLKVLALFIIDIVEGSAVDALPSMKPLIRSRPSGFESIEKAIEWTLKTGQVRSQYSARLSVPGQLKKIDPGPTKQDGSNGSKDSGISLSSSVNKPARKEEVIHEEDECETESSPAIVTASTSGPTGTSVGAFKQPVVYNYAWRIDVLETEKYWLEWFTGMSKKFLNIECPKYLLLANVDRLDRELTIAQMQGKFQMSCIQDVGHAVQEDKPELVGEQLSTFMIRHKIAKSRPGNRTIMPYPSMI